MEEWQTKRAVPEPRLTTGFLDGIQPIVDSYELKVSNLWVTFAAHVLLPSVCCFVMLPGLGGAVAVCLPLPALFLPINEGLKP